MGVKLFGMEMGKPKPQKEAEAPALVSLDISGSKPVTEAEAAPAPRTPAPSPKPAPAPPKEPFDPAKVSLNREYGPEAKKVPLSEHPEHQEFAAAHGYDDDTRTVEYIHQWLYQLRLIHARQQEPGYPNNPVDPENPPCQLAKQLQLMDWLALRYPVGPDKYARHFKLKEAAKVQFLMGNLKEHQTDKNYPKVTEAEVAGLKTKGGKS